jgi:hypothetical protein
VIYSVVRRAMRHQSPGAPDSGHLHSLIKVKLVRPKLSAHGVDRSVRNAAVSPIVWTFSAMPALAATAMFDRPVLLAIGIGICACVYHWSYRYLARKQIQDFGDSQELASVAAYKPIRRRPAHQRHRARDRRAVFGRGQ